jgi:peptidoglycan/xylan/chitin deacetylase (PgdA/CDA1 family)
MSSSLAILCYHRLCDERELAAAWPYLERGTAVRMNSFRSQVAELEGFADIVDESVALDVLAGRRSLDRPAVWLSFDDGYQDTMRAMPLVANGTAFITTSTMIGRVLPADAWYSVLLASSRTHGELDLGFGVFSYDLSNRSGRARLINGPERRAYLRAPPAAQEAALNELAERLDAQVARPHRYLCGQDLEDLVGMGWTLGSHGETHAPFDTLDPGELAREAATSRAALSKWGSPIRSLALPDGAIPKVEMLRSMGYECVLGLGDATAAPGAPVHARFIVPDDPRWVSRVLQPKLEGARA